MDLFFFHKITVPFSHIKKITLSDTPDHFKRFLSLGTTDTLGQITLL